MRYWVANHEKVHLGVGSTVSANIYVKICLEREKYWREKGHDMKSYRVQYDPRTEEEIANWRYLGPPQFGPSTRHKGLFIRIFKRFFGMSKHRNYPDGGFRKQERNAA